MTAPIRLALVGIGKIARGHDVRVYEPINPWSLTNLLADAGEAGLEPYRRHYPELSSQSIAPGHWGNWSAASASAIWTSWGMSTSAA